LANQHFVYDIREREKNNACSAVGLGVCGPESCLEEGFSSTARKSCIFLFTTKKIKRNASNIVLSVCFLFSFHMI